MKAVCLVFVVGACGSVSEDRPAADAATVDAWSASCAPPASITSVESSEPGFGNACVHGGWALQALNGTTLPVTAGKPLGQTVVAPTPIAPGTNPNAATSTFAVHVSGSGQENHPPTFAFVQLTATLNTPSATQIGTVDATAYTGVEFDAIIKTAATGCRFTLGNMYTEPAGGKCTTVTGQPTSCFDDPGVQLTPSTAWTHYKVAFADLVQIGFGNPSPLGASFPKDAIFHIRWDLGILPNGPTEPWELWVDSVTFY